MIEWMDGETADEIELQSTRKRVVFWASSSMFAATISRPFVSAARELPIAAVL